MQVDHTCKEEVKTDSLSGKRFFDLTVAIASTFFLMPFFLLITLGYYLQGQTDLFFNQPRIGKDGVIFSIVKFRTLTDDDLPLQQRRFAWGDFLRKYSLDELPQLVNVIRGEMSLVGPRPLPMEYASLFSKEQQIRHDVRPGITGWAQVNGRNSISWDKKFEYDLFYVRNLSFCLDLKILYKTMLLIFSFRKDVSLDEEKFKG